MSYQEVIAPTKTPEALRLRFEKYLPMKPSPARQDNEYHENAMADSDSVSRYELDAKLEAIEARMDGRVARIESSIEQIQKGNLEFQVELRADKSERRVEMRNLKLTIITTAIAAVIALYGANIGLIQTMFGAFESGKATAAAFTQATEQMKQTQEQLKVIQDRLDRQASSPGLTTSTGNGPLGGMPNAGPPLRPEGAPPPRPNTGR